MIYFFLRVPNLRIPILIIIHLKIIAHKVLKNKNHERFFTASMASNTAEWVEVRRVVMSVASYGLFRPVLYVFSDNLV
ncbi:hypothetical protein ACFL35_19365 [Candidatus Riflebacteria bacterium]